MFKLLLIGWSILCGCWVLFSLFLGTLRGTEPGEEAAYACMSIFGSATGLIAWFIGVVPLGILYAIFGQSRGQDYMEERFPQGDEERPVRRRRAR